jgi:hypothetical protein
VNQPQPHYTWANLKMFPTLIGSPYWSWGLTLGSTRAGIPHASLQERGQVLTVPDLSLEAQAREALFEVARLLRAG